MGQQSSQMGGASTQEQNENPEGIGSSYGPHGAGPTSSAADKTRPLGSRAHEKHAAASQNGEPGKQAKKRKRRDHNKEEESARTLLEMNQWRSSAKTGPDVTAERDADGVVGPAATTSREIVKDAQATPRATKRRKSSNTDSPERSRAEIWAGESGRTTKADARDNANSGSNEHREGSHAQGNKPSAALHQDSSLEDSAVQLPSPPGTIGNDRSFSQHHPAEHRSPGGNEPAKSRSIKKQKRSSDAVEHAAKTLADAASAASALIDPALAVWDDDDGDAYDVSAENDPGDADLGLESRSDHDDQGTLTKAATRKHKRRLPLPFGDRVVMPPSRQQQQQLEQQGERRRGPLPHEYSTADIALMTEYMDNYRVAHSLNWSQLNDRVQRNNNRNAKDTFWSDLAALFPTRREASVQKVARRRFHNYEKRGIWSESDDEALQAAFAVHGKKWKRIGQQIGRLGEDCRDRWRNYLACGDSRRSGEWTKAEEEQLTSAVGECMDTLRRELQSHDGGDGGGGGIPMDFDPKREAELRDKISWAVVSEKMGNTRSRLQCQYKWKKLGEGMMLVRRSRGSAGQWINASQAATTPGRESWRTIKARQNTERWMPGDYYHLLKSIRDTKSESEAAIPWRIIGPEPWRSSWSCADRRIAFASLTDTIADAHERPLMDVVDELIVAIETERADELYNYYEHGPGHSLKRDARKRQRKAKAKPAPSPFKSMEHVSETEEEDDGDATETTEEVDPSEARLRDYPQVEVVIDARALPLGSGRVGGEKGEVELGDTFMALDAVDHVEGSDASAGDEEDGEEEGTEDEDRRMAEQVALLRHA